MAFDIRTSRQDETVGSMSSESVGSMSSESVGSASLERFDAVRAAAEVDPVWDCPRAWGALEGDKR